MNKLSLKRRLTFFIASILVAITIILTSLTLITVEKVMVRPQIETIGIITFTSRDGHGSNRIEIVREKDDEYLVFEDDGLNNHHGRNMRRRNTVNAIDREMIGRDAVISDMRSAQSKLSRISLLAMIGIIIFGVLGVYIMIDRALEPLKELSTTIHDIGEDNLNTQIKVPVAEDEISSLIVSFNKMLSRLEVMFKEQKNFSAKAAHELKTPLTTMKTSLQVLQMDEDPPMDEYRENVVLMENNIDRLIDTVNNLFLLSSDSIKLNDKVELDNIVYSVLETRKDDIENKNISVRLSLAKVIIPGNMELINSCISNIIDNAIKYNLENGSISIKLSKEGSMARISVKDTGIGISEDGVKNMFDAFYRVDTSKVDGNGLGLSIVKNIVEEHNGNISVDSKLGVGTEVILKIPR